MKSISEDTTPRNALQGWYYRKGCYAEMKISPLRFHRLLRGVIGCY